MSRYRSWIRRPEYTGENRCVPCTIANAIITALLAAVVAAVSLPIAAAVLLVGFAAIYFRGYLIPGTPTLTKRYFPEPVLRAFDKYDEPEPPTIVDDTDVETFLISVDAVEPCHDGQDLCLTASFRSAWEQQIEHQREVLEDSEPSALFDSLDIDPERVQIEAHGDAYDAYVDEVHVGQWESQAAYLADVAADAELRDRHSGWQHLGFEARTEVLGALRLWLDWCPSCGGAVTLGEETVESCCRSVDVLAATCEDCGARVFEAPLAAEAIAEQ